VKFTFAAATVMAVTLAAAPGVRAGGERVAFPEKFADGTLYAVVERADIKQYRELYAPAAAVAAAKKGEPLPDGTVITMVAYTALPDVRGNPQKDVKGRFIKGVRLGHFVMEKRAGWGADYPEDKRNSDWEYRAFTANRKVNEKAKLAACFACHKPKAQQDFVFSFDKMKTAK
jgi:hypothetical protein